MNQYLERQKLECHHCNGKGNVEYLYSTDGNRCILCCGTGFELESHEAYEARLVRMIDLLVKWCITYKIGWEGTEKERNAWIRDAFKEAEKEASNDK